jgi:hypothetical protein
MLEISFFLSIVSQQENKRLATSTASRGARLSTSLISSYRSFPSIPPRYISSRYLAQLLSPGSCPFENKYLGGAKFLDLAHFDCFVRPM